MSLFLKGKMTKRSFTRKDLRTKISSELVNTDLCGPTNVKIQRGYEYFNNFVDDYSRFGHVYLLHHRFDSLEKFREYKAEGENQLGKAIKTLRPDRGEEYVDLRFQDYLIEHKI